MKIENHMLWIFGMVSYAAKWVIENIPYVDVNMLKGLDFEKWKKKLLWEKILQKYQLKIYKTLQILIFCSQNHIFDFIWIASL